MHIRLLQTHTVDGIFKREMASDHFPVSLAVSFFKNVILDGNLWLNI